MMNCINNRITKKVSVILVLFIAFLFGISECKAADSDGIRHNGIYPSYLLARIVPNGIMNVQYNTEDGEGMYTAGSVQMYYMTLNGKTSFCAEYDDKYGYNVRYRVIGIIPGSSGSFVNYLYGWGSASKDDYNNAQALIWGLSILKYFDLSNLEAVGNASYTLYRPKFDIKNETDYKSFLSRYITLAGGTEHGDLGAKWRLPDPAYCRCIFKKDCSPSLGNILRVESDVDGSVDLTLDPEITSGGTYSYSFVEIVNPDYATLCDNMTKNANDPKKQDEIYKEFLAARMNEFGQDVTDNLNNNELAESYSKIIGSKPEDVAIYEPVDSDDNYQRVIGPTPDKMNPDCSNILSAIKADHPEWGPDEIIAHYGDTIKTVTSQDLFKYNGDVFCKDFDKNCVKTKREYYNVKVKPNPHFSGKFSNKFIYSWESSTITTENNCLCDIEKNKFNKKDSSLPIYSKSCADFKDWFNSKGIYIGNGFKEMYGLSVTDKVMYCEGEVADCNYNGPNPKVCETFLNGGYKSYETCAKVKAQIDDPVERARVICTDNGHEITSYSCEPTNPKKCKPKVHGNNLKCDTKWRINSQLHLQDATLDSDGNINWEECIMKNEAYNVDGEQIFSEDTELGSTYCSVFCWESFDLQLPADPTATNFYANGTTDINAGKLFWWGLDYNRNIFGVIEANRICRTEPNYKKFEDDWAANEKDIMQKYANYMAQKNYYDNINNIETKSKECELEAAKPGSGCCKMWRNGPNTGFTGECRNISDSACAGKGTYDYSGGGTPAVMGIQYYKEKVKQDVYDINGNKYSGESQELTTSCLSKGSGVPSGFDWGSQAKSEMESRKNKLTSTSDGAISNRTRLIAAIKKCQDDKLSYSEIYNYTFKMEITDTAIQNTWGVKTLVMDGSRGDESITTNKDSQVTYSQTLNCNLIDDGDMKVSSDPCRNLDNDFYSVQYGGKSFKIRTYRPFEWNYKGHYYIKYPSSFHFIAYPNDDNVQSIDVTDDNRELLRIVYGLSYDEGMGIPTKINIYGGNFSIGVKMSGYGNDSHFDKLAESGDFSDEFEPIKGGKYVCPYTMANPLYTPPGDDDCPDKNCGIQLVYRIIEMASGNKSRIFPGREGNDGNTNRRIGSNWASFVDTNKFKKITTTGEIYGKNPLYSIELSPSLISEIRRNNNSYRDNGKDPYTSYQDTNNNFKITCQFGSEKGKASLQSCTSNYITDLIKRGKITGRFAEGNEELRRKMILEYK